MAAQKCEPVLLPFVADVLARLNELQLEVFFERAGIIEFEAGQPRALAECLALLGILVRWPDVLTGAVVLEIERDGATDWLLVSDLAGAREYIKDIGAVEIVVRRVADVVNSQYNGVAMLATVG